MFSVSWRTIVALSITVVVLSLLALACEEEEKLPVGPPAATASPGAASPTPAVTGSPTAAEPLTVELELKKAVFRSGEDVDLTLALTANTSEPLTLYYRTSQRYDFVVTTREGKEVWRWSAERTFLQELGQETLEPGKKVSYSESWDQKDTEGNQVPPGVYMASAESPHCDSDYQNCGASTSPLAIEIVSR